MRNLMTTLALALLAGNAAHCGPETENPLCGEGLITTEDGCVPDPAALCGPGTVFDGTSCVLDADVTNPDDTAGADTSADATDPEFPDVSLPEQDVVDAGPCLPNCENRTCGDDGCGGTCGDCNGGSCNLLGACVPSAWKCADYVYGDNVSCDCGCGAPDPDCDVTPALATFGCEGNDRCDAGVCAACTPACGAGVECGDDGCGGSCGRCWDPLKPMCVDGTCVDKCVPDCREHECGPDGCGGVCGECGPGENCVVAICLPLPEALSCVGRCGDVAPGGCSCSDACSGSGCCGDAAAACACVPACDGKTCGPDGCGGTCGTCLDGTQCNGSTCVDDPCQPDPCGGRGTCGAGGVCSCNSGFAGAGCGECQSGFIGFPNCVLNRCTGQDCGAGTCEPTTGMCVCNAGVTGPRCQQCAVSGRTWPECEAPNCSTGPDSDFDGVPDICDACPNNGSIATWNWVQWNSPISGNVATGLVGGVTVTYTSDRPLQSTPDLFAHTEVFASLTEFVVPNSGPVLKNAEITNNTLTFSRPIVDPILVFSSIGTAGVTVPIEFSSDVEILWSSNVVQSNPRVIRGTEGFAIVRMAGIRESVTFRYTVAEDYANFLFGFGGNAEVDYDGNGTPDICQADLRNNIGCSDGGREGFISTESFPNIAACAGGWSFAGLVTESGGTITDQVDRCANASGDDSANPTGNGCSSEDLCAAGWTVCADQAAVAARGGGTACASLGASVAAPFMFATRQRSQGGYICDISLDPQGMNDVYGCGSNDFGFALSNCGPLNRVTDDNCGNVANATVWECNDNDPGTPGSVRELKDVTKPAVANGGVLCCRN